MAGQVRELLRDMKADPNSIYKARKLKLEIKNHTNENWWTNSKTKTCEQMVNSDLKLKLRHT